MTTMILLFFLCGVALAAMMALLRVRKSAGKLSWRAARTNIFCMPKFRIGVALLAFLYAAVFSVCYIHFEQQTASAVISLNYDEAYKGQNANGTRYNMSEIISEEVVQRAIEKGALKNVTAKALKECLTVEPLVEGSAYIEEQYHISTEFKVTFEANKNTAHLDAENVVMLIGHAYKDYYIDTYADDFNVLVAAIDDQTDYTTMDYLDAVEALSYKVQRVQGYMYELANENPGFVSTTGETFQSLAAKCDNVNTVQIGNNLKAYLLDNGVSRNPEKYIDRLSFDNNRYDFEHQRAKASFDVRNQAVNMYAEEMTRITLIPTWDTTGEFYMGRTKVGVDSLSLEASEFSRLAADYFEGIETNRLLIEKMKQSTSEGSNAYVDQMIERIGAEIKELAQDAMIVSREYSEAKMNRCISTNAMEHSFAKYVILCAALFVMFYVAASVFVQAKQTKKG
ncbi:MAG: hypothetical protein IJE08_12980 [Clostridia bacterium]|nr:hypothetical protein [Clostridia bacterium]